MLETLGQTNIGNLSLVEPGAVETNPFFDSEKDLTEQDWDLMLKKFEENGNLISDLQMNRVPENRLGQHLFTGVALKLLSPERFKQIHLPDDLLKTSTNMLAKKRSWADNLLNGLTGKLQASEIRDSVEILANLSILFPEERAGIRRSCRNFVEPCLNDLMVGQPDIYEHVFNLSVLFPTEILPEVRAQGAEPYREHFVDFASVGKNFFGWSKSGLFSMTWPKATYKILFPDEPTLVSKDEWVDMKKGIARIRGNNNLLAPMADLALCMKILTAEKASITKDGDIDIVMSSPKQDLALVTPPIPEVRKF
ncbi:MAG: hypothetical protein Q7R49_01770 [Candidatus Daviesbacteria bacterium]|nr:hypothetical protein [Candidatus Daviesbacteria bacterium]